MLENATRVRLSEEETAALNSRTEGWVAGLQMAAISLRGAENPSTFIQSFAGSHRYIFDYLIEQVLDRQLPEVKEFLLKTSILERLCASLCDAAAGTSGRAQNVLESIERANLFLVPLDDEHGWYRYHHLFSDLLILVLEQTHPGLPASLHHQACRWYQTHGMLSEALHHGLAAGDMEFVANIVSENVLALVENAEIAPALARIEAIPAERHVALPWLDVAYAWGLAYTGQNQRAGLVLAKAEQRLGQLAGEKRRKALGHITAVRAYLALMFGDRSPDAVTFAEKARELLPDEEIAVRALNLITLGKAMFRNADDPQAIPVMEQAIQLARQADRYHVLMQASTALAYMYILLGKSNRAQVICEEAIEVAESYQRTQNRPLTSVASVYAVLSRVRLEAGEFEKAIQIARKGLALSKAWGQLDAMIVCSEYLAYALGFANRMEDAWAVIQDARKIAWKGPPGYSKNLDYLKVQIYLDSDPQSAAEIESEAALRKETLEKVNLVAARVLLKQNQPVEALALVEHELASSNKYGDYVNGWLHALKALAYYQQKDHAAALRALKQALEWAEVDNYVTIFVREGMAMEKLLRLAQARAIFPAFVSRLLAACEHRRKQKPVSKPLAETLIEPLSYRELEVLQHLSSHLSTPEIAGLLVVSANTVRTHIKSIYGKLGVHGRSEAVRRASELGLLS